MRTRAVVIALVLAGVAGCTREHYASLEDVPPQVRATFRREARGGSVSDIIHQWKKGEMVYTADVTDASGQTWDVHVAEDGHLISKD